MLAAVFLFSGVTKALWPAEAVAEFSALGLLAPEVLVVGVVLFQLATGTMLLLGVWVIPAALALAGFTALATLVGHPFWQGDTATVLRQTTIALEHLGLVGGLLALVVLHSMERQRHANPQQ
ncbi:MAG: DoxX family protein [Pseudomonadota bacterium]